MKHARSWSQATLLMTLLAACSSAPVNAPLIQRLPEAPWQSTLTPEEAKKLTVLNAQILLEQDQVIAAQAREWESLRARERSFPASPALSVTGGFGRYRPYYGLGL